jgi:hypothetical protein
MDVCVCVCVGGGGASTASASQRCIVLERYIAHVSVTCLYIHAHVSLYACICLCNMSLYTCMQLYSARRACLCNMSLYTCTCLYHMARYTCIQLYSARRASESLVLQSARQSLVEYCSESIHVNPRAHLEVIYIAVIYDMVHILR